MKTNNQAGFTYAESLLAMVLLAAVLAPLLIAFPTGSHEARLAKNMTMAVNLAEDLMDEIKSKRMDENTATPLTAPPLGYETGEWDEPNKSRTGFDDVDDYNGWPPTDVTSPVDMHGVSLSPEFSEFRRTVTVGYVAWDDIGQKWDDSAVATDYKKITVSVSGPYHPTVTLCTIVAFY